MVDPAIGATGDIDAAIITMLSFNACLSTDLLKMYNSMAKGE